MQVLKKLSFILILVVLFACDTSPAFVGTWELVSLELADDEITANELGDPVYTFNKDNSYTIEVTGLRQEGTWELQGESLLLRDNDNPEDVTTLTIVQAEKTIFHYTAGEGETQSNVILKRAD